MFKRLGIFGGTFNPIHNGHLLLAESAREKLKLERILFIPTASPAHKPHKDLLPAAARLQMVRLAIRGNPIFAASDIELRRGGISYTVDTLQTIKQLYPQAQLYLLVGQDMLGVRWRSWAIIRRLAKVAVAARPGAHTKNERVIALGMPLVGIASSDIRDRLWRGLSIRYQVPAAVEHAIAKYGWYQDAKKRRKLKTAGS